jgi:ferredoxin
MRIVIDRDKCQAHNRCAMYLPEVFAQYDEQGFPILSNDGHFGREAADGAQLAVDNCPEQALSIE